MEVINILMRWECYFREGVGVCQGINVNAISVSPLQTRLQRNCASTAKGVEYSIFIVGHCLYKEVGDRGF